MRVVLLILSCAILSFAGTIWPQPDSLARGTTTIYIDPTKFVIQAAPGSSTALLQGAISRYSSLFFPFPPAGPPPPGPQITVLMVTVSEVMENPPLQIGVDESYVMTVEANGTAMLLGNTVWGAMHGLETFSQLIDFNLTSNTYYVSNTPVQVSDLPRFIWRGLLIDTSRHFLTPDTVYRTIDALSYNKMNTLHWHAVDAQSFPMQSFSYPLLQAMGAYNPYLAIFTQETIMDIVNYGYERGVRVLPEFDVPGHAYSWGKGYPTIRAQCPANLAANVNNFPLDPSQNLTFQVLSGLYGEMSNIFFDEYFHTGGDEVVYSCWTGDPDISNWMKQMGFTTGQQVFQYFETQLQGIVAGINRTMVVWQDVFDAGITMPLSTVVQVWSNGQDTQNVVNAGFRALASYAYYEDKQKPIWNSSHYEFEDTWQDFYLTDPYTNVTKYTELIIGGEAAMWGEQVDDTCFDVRVWPRAAAVGERLWSQQSVTNVTDAIARMEQFRCVSMARRGINAGPIEPDFCPTSLSNPNLAKKRATKKWIF